MDDAKFQSIARTYLAKLRHVFEDGESLAASGASLLAYNAYLEDTEVVVLGLQTTEDGHAWTEPLAIFVTEEVFDRLTVDDESGRRKDDEDLPAQVRVKS